MNYYKVLTGMNWTGTDGEDMRAEPGEVRDDVPEVSVPWLLADGHLEVATEPAPAVAPVASEPAAWSEPLPSLLNRPPSGFNAFEHGPASEPTPADASQPSVLQAELADLAAERAALAAERAAIRAEEEAIHIAPGLPDVRGL